MCRTNTAPCCAPTHLLRPNTPPCSSAATPRPLSPLTRAGEAEHAAIGHAAVLNMVPTEHIPTVRRAMADHDRDFAAFYNHVADMLEGKI